MFLSTVRIALTAGVRATTASKKMEVLTPEKLTIIQAHAPAKGYNAPGSLIRFLPGMTLSW